MSRLIHTNAAAVMAALLSALTALAAAGQAAVQLKVLSATVNSQSHGVRIELQNQNAVKTVTAYMLNIKEFDNSNNLVNESNVGFDCLLYNPNGRKSDVIPPGGIFIRTPTTAPQNAISVKVTTTGVVYDDRTAEGGNATGPLFGQRALLADKLTRAANLFNTYPSSPEAFRTTVQAARQIAPARVDLVLYKNLNVPRDMATDNAHPLAASVPIPNSQQWKAAQDALLTEAAFWVAQSQEVR